MKRLITNLIVLGALGAATMATAQELTPAQREARARDAQANRARGLTPAQRYDRTYGPTPAQRLTPGQRYDRAYGPTPAQQAARGNWNQYQRNVWATRRFQAGFWRAPQGYYYQRWTWGQTLPGIYFSQNYWIPNFFAYGLFAPPAGLVWVRYGPDALLVNRFTGQIVQVRYGLFY
jgi:Ni/Co efflux regulator RcnB